MMAPAAREAGGNGRRRSILDLAPLERDCMQALWPLGEATVREIRDRMAEVRPRAYTTVMTIMDRLAQKGVVTRVRAGRAYLYRPSFTAEDVQAHAVEQLVDHFFEGSREALRAHLSGSGVPVPRTAMAVARAPRTSTKEQPQPAEEELFGPHSRLDDTLL